MSRAPSTIHIKRKATDDPVDVLRVHELNGKRQRRATEFVFTRQPAEASATATDGVASAQPSLTGRRPIKPLPRSGVSQIAGLPAATSTTATHKHEATVKATSPAGQPDSHTANNKTSQQTPLDAGSELTPLQVAQHRRFHISRTSTSGGRQSPVIGGKVQKRTPTVFIERRPQPLVSRDVTPVNKTGLPTSATTPETEQSRPLKKPGLAARTTSKQTSQPDSAKLAPPTATPARNIRLPSGLVMPWDVTSDKLAQELQAYTLQEIGRAVAESESTDPNSHPDPQSSMYSIRKKGPSKFKPKKPLLRYHERHPEVAAPSPAQNMEVDSTDEDGEYIIDTYIRMPADQVGWDWQENFGYLVLESQPDIDEFYHEDSDHSETEEYDEEDENAENHYSADYPEEEIESDDEYDRNAYHYRTRNASDDEEFDENDPMDDDDDDDATRYPWRKPKLPPWLRKKNGIQGTNEGEDEDEFDEDGSDYVPNANSEEQLTSLFHGLTTQMPSH